MASQMPSETSETSEPWATYVTSFSIPDYNFAPTNHLLYQPQTWQNGASHPESHPEPHLEFYLEPYLESHPEPTNQVDPELNSEDEMDFAMGTGGEQGGIADEAPEEVEEDDIEHVTCPVASHGLPPLPNNFQPFRNEKHPRKWCLPYGFGGGPRVNPPQGCTDTCSYAGHGAYCTSTAPDLGTSVEDRWDLPLLIFSLFFSPQVLETLVINTNRYAASKNVGLPGAGQQTRRPWKEVTVPELKIWLGIIIYMSVVKLARVDEYWTKNGEWLINFKILSLCGAQR